MYVKSIYIIGGKTAKEDSRISGNRIRQRDPKAETEEHIVERGPLTEGQTVEPGPLTAEHKGETGPQTGETEMRSREAETHAGTVIDRITEGLTAEEGITLEGVHQANIEAE